MTHLNKLARDQRHHHLIRRFKEVVAISLQRGNALALIQGSANARNAACLSSSASRPSKSARVVKRTVESHLRCTVAQPRVVVDEIKVTTDVNTREDPPLSLPSEHNSLAPLPSAQKKAPPARTVQGQGRRLSVELAAPVGADGSLAGMMADANAG